MRKISIVQPIAGLANRMRVIAGMVYYAEKYNNHKPIVIWEKSDECFSSLSNLFDVESLKRHIHLYEYTKGKETLIKRFLFKASNLFGFYVVGNDIAAQARTDESIQKEIANNNTFALTWESPSTESDFSYFKPSEKILSLNPCNTQGMIGVHIRRTDNKRSIKYSPTSLFVENIKRILEENPKQKFYLSTDDKNEEMYLKNLFRDSILTYEKRSLDRGREDAIEDAVIDLYNLSCCKKILGSYYSSFSDIAAAWKGVEKEVLTVEV